MWLAMRVRARSWAGRQESERGTSAGKPSCAAARTSRFPRTSTHTNPSTRSSTALHALPTMRCTSSGSPEGLAAPPTRTRERSAYTTMMHAMPIKRRGRMVRVARHVCKGHEEVEVRQHTLAAVAWLRAWWTAYSPCTAQTLSKVGLDEGKGDPSQ